MHSEQQTTGMMEDEMSRTQSTDQFDNLDTPVNTLTELEMSPQELEAIKEGLAAKLKQEFNEFNLIARVNKAVGDEDGAKRFQDLARQAAMKYAKLRGGEY